MPPVVEKSAARLAARHTVALVAASPAAAARPATPRTPAADLGAASAAALDRPRAVAVGSRQRRGSSPVVAAAASKRSRACSEEAVVVASRPSQAAKRPRGGGHEAKFSPTLSEKELRRDDAEVEIELDHKSVQQSKIR